MVCLPSLTLVFDYIVLKTAVFIASCLIDLGILDWSAAIKICIQLNVTNTCGIHIYLNKDCVIPDVPQCIEYSSWNKEQRLS